MLYVLFMCLYDIQCCCMDLTVFLSGLLGFLFLLFLSRVISFGFIEVNFLRCNNHGLSISFILLPPSYFISYLNNRPSIFLCGKLIILRFIDCG